MSLGSGEIFIILILALLLFGPDKLPELARQTARVIRDVRRAADEVKSQFNLLGDDDDEPQRPLSNMREKINDHRDSKANDELSSTRSANNPPIFDADEIENDSYYINDADGNAPADNNWNEARSSEQSAQSNGETKNAGQSWAPMPLADSRLDSAPTSAQNPTQVAPPNDDVLAATNNLELRVTPSTSVARSSAPNRVRIEDDETTA